MRVASGVLVAISLQLCVTTCGDRATAPPDLTAPQGSELYGTFEGRVPCANCERIKVGLTLHRRVGDASPATYVLQQIFVGIGNERHVSKGTWTIIRGSAIDPDARVYLLDAHAPEEARRYMAVGDDLLLMLDDALVPRVGDAAHSFTLSRTR